MGFKPEWIALAVNVGSLIYYIAQRSQSGKILYWLGATLLTAGLLKMKG